MRPFQTFPSSGTRPPTKPSSSLHPSSPHRPHRNRRSQITRSRRQTSRFRRRRLRRTARTSPSSSRRSPRGSPRSRRPRVPSARVLRATPKRHRVQRYSPNSSGCATRWDGAWSGSLANSPPSRTTAPMRSKTARDLVGPFTLLQSPVRLSFLFYSLVLNCHPFSVVLLSTCPCAALLPDHGLRRAPPRATRARARVRRVKHARQSHHSAPQLPHQLHHEPAHFRMRARRLLTPAELCGLSRGLSPLALLRLVPTMRRIPSDAARPGAAATTNARSDRRAGATNIRNDAAQCGPRQRQLYRAAAVHRDVQRRGPRVPHIPRLPLPAHTVYREQQLWCRIHRQR